MSNWLSNISVVLTWLVRIAGIILTAIGKNAEVNAVLSNMQGAFASSGEYAAEVATSWNWQASGISTFLVSFVIPKVFEFLGTKFGGKKTGWNAIADASALGTLKNITRVGRADDIAHIDALIASGVKLETDARINGGV